MRGLVFKGNRQVALEDVPQPAPGPGEVLVAMRASGICGSDLNLYRKPVSTDRSYAATSRVAWWSITARVFRTAMRRSVSG
jgi:threonine dehydrogenase-like Zn-dependent dehydrogenase